MSSEPKMTAATRQRLRLWTSSQSVHSSVNSLLQVHQKTVHIMVLICHKMRLCQSSDYRHVSSSVSTQHALHSSEVEVMDVVTACAFVSEQPSVSSSEDSAHYGPDLSSETTDMSVVS